MRATHASSSSPSKQVARRGGARCVVNGQHPTLHQNAPGIPGDAQRASSLLAAAVLDSEGTFHDCEPAKPGGIYTFLALLAAAESPAPTSKSSVSATDLFVQRLHDCYRHPRPICTHRALTLGKFVNSTLPVDRNFHQLLARDPLLRVEYQHFIDPKHQR